MRMITATDANRDFSKLLDQVAKGDTVNITKHGEIVATLVPAARTLKAMEKAHRMHLQELMARKPIPGLTRGTRDELYEDD